MGVLYSGQEGIQNRRRKEKLVQPDAILLPIDLSRRFLHCRFLHRKPSFPVDRLPDGIPPGGRKALLVERQRMVKNNNDIQVDSEQMSTGVEILLKMSDKTLSSTREYIQ